MPTTTTSTVTAKLETTTVQTVYPAYFIRNVFNPSSYLHHFQVAESDSPDVNLTAFDVARAWKVDKDNSSPNLSIVSAARGSTVTSHLNDTLRLDPVSTRKWVVEQVDTNAFRIHGSTPDIESKYWTLNPEKSTVKLQTLAGKNAPAEEQAKQHWVFEAVLFA